MKKILNTSCLLLTSLLLLVLVACTDYAAQMEDDFEEWRAAQLLSSEDDESSSSVTPGSSSVKSQSSSSGKSQSSSSGKLSSSVESSSSSSVVQGSVDPSTVVEGTITDSRDDQTYKTVTIGTQTWMAQNLNYETTNSYCFDDESSNCTKYGRLYTWAAAMDSAGTWSVNGKGCGYSKTCSPTYPVRGVCPSGWHLPSQTEWNALFTAVGDSTTAGKALKSQTGWGDYQGSSGNGTDAYAFSALPASYRLVSGEYYGGGIHAIFWSSTENGSKYAYLMAVSSYYGDGAHLYDDIKNFGFSVRCIKDDGETAESSSSKKDESSSSSSVKSSSSAASSSSEEAESSSSKTAEPAVGTLTDSRDGQTYKTVKIGDQVWMAENLNYAYTGAPYDYAGYTSDSTSWCYGDDPANCAKYGRLYTWPVAMDSMGTWSANGKGCGYNKTCSPTYPVRGICPEGWHLPTKAEFETLFDAVGGSSTAGNMLKSASGWFADYNGTDAYSFSALPAGYRSFDGDYDYEGDYTRFWSSTEYGNNYAYYMDLRYVNESAEMRNVSIYYGVSVRCVKD